VLKTRVITALVILPIVLIALFAFPAWAWAMFAFGIAMVACWEWSRLSQMNSLHAKFFLVVSFAISAVICVIYLRDGTGAEFDTLKQTVLAFAVVFWMIAAPLWLANLWHPASLWLRGLTGLVVIIPMALAMISLRAISPWLLLSFAAIIWVADIAAYFTGKKFGRNKLAPAISPGKTIEGVAGGLAGVVLFFFVWQFLTASTAVRENVWVVQMHAHLTALFILFVVLALLSVLGDLFESWMKRGAGMKDSSNLLPGHGGVLDRIDALTSTLPLAALYAMLMLPPR
jgi:phosphatidate cytidylyltransferase